MHFSDDVSGADDLHDPGQGQRSGCANPETPTSDFQVSYQHQRFQTLSSSYLLSGLTPDTSELPTKYSARRTTRASSSVSTRHSAPLPPLQESCSFQGMWISIKRSRKKTNAK